MGAIVRSDAEDNDASADCPAIERGLEGAASDVESCGSAGRG